MRPKRHDVIHAVLERAKDAKDLGINPTAWIQKVFGLSRQQTARYLTDLCMQGLLARHGVGPGVRYLYVAHRKIILQREWSRQEVQLSSSTLVNSFSRDLSVKALPPPAHAYLVKAIEILLSNVNDHSEAGIIRFDLSLEDETITLNFADDGVGLFQHIAENFHSPSLVEAVGDFVKGVKRQKTDSNAGLDNILWSADFARIEANGLQLKIVGRSHDWSLVHLSKIRSGTVFSLEFDPAIPRPLPQRTVQRILIPVWMYCQTLPRRVADQRDARRMLRGHGEQQQIILDFHRVDELNYSFMYYVFIRFKNQHPKCGLMPVNMNAGIRSLLILIQKDKEPSSRHTRKGRA